MKIFHTADWHLGKVVQGVSMIEDQRYVLQQFLTKIEEEQPDVIIIAGDLYDRAIPPPDAVSLLNDVLDKIVIDLNIPVIAIAGNHDSPSRLHFGSNLMRKQGFHLIGRLEEDFLPIALQDEYGEVHFHAVPFCDPSIVRNLFQEDSIKTHDDAMNFLTNKIEAKMDPNARHVFIGHAFVTPLGEKQENTSDSERTLSVGGAEYVSSTHFSPFNYVALGHLHQSHYVKEDYIRYAGSILKYSASEARHEKGFYAVDINGNGEITIEKKLLTPLHDLRLIEAEMEEILAMEQSDDYVFIKLLDKKPILSPMEKARSIFPNAMHIERHFDQLVLTENKQQMLKKTALSDTELFTAFYEEVRGFTCEAETIESFNEILNDLLKIENETIS